MSTVPHITSQIEYQTIISSSTYSVLYFYARCNYCVRMTPVVEKSAKKSANYYGAGILNFYRVDGNASWPGLQRIQKQLEIPRYPRVFLFRDNKVCEVFGGYGPYSEFKEWLSVSLLGSGFRACTANAEDSEDASDSEDSDDSDDDFEDAFEDPADFEDATFEDAADFEDGADPEDSEDDADENSPLVICNNILDDNLFDEKEIFVTSSIRTARYFKPLRAYLRQIAVSKADDARFLLLIMDKQEPSVEEYLLNYRPYVQFFLDKECLFSCQFRSGELTEHFSKWIEDCFTASRIIKPIEAQGDKPDEDESEKSIVEVSSKGVLYEEFRHGNLSVVLCHDSSPPSIAMVTVQKRAARHLYVKGMQLFRINYETIDAFVELFSLRAGPTTIIFCQGIKVAEKTGVMSVADFEKWVEHILHPQNKLPVPTTKTKHKSMQSISASILSEDTNPASRPVSRASGASHWDAAYDAERLHNRIKCEGGQEDRERRNLLRGLLTKSKPFLDIERGCVIVPSDAHEGLQLGRASDGGSYFNLTLRLSLNDPLKIEFRVEFGTDPTISLNSRFESATLTIDFGYDDEHGRSHVLKLHEVRPRELKGESTVMQMGTGTETSLSLGVGSTPASINAGGKLTSSTSYSRTTEQIVKGHGEMTNTAHWTFVEDAMAQHGLSPHYELSVALKKVNIPFGEIWMTFWGRAMLKLPGRKEMLKLGSKEQPHKRTVLLDIDT